MTLPTNPTEETPPSKRARMLVHCALPNGETRVVPLDEAEAITSTPSSKGVKRRIQHVYEHVPGGPGAEELTFVPLDRKPGGPWEGWVSPDPLLARLKERQTRKASESAVAEPSSVDNSLEARMQRLTDEMERSKVEMERLKVEAERSKVETDRLKVEAERSKVETDRLTVETERLNLQMEHSKADNSKLSGSVSFLLEGQRHICLYGAITVIAKSLDPHAELSEAKTPASGSDNMSTFLTRISKAVKGRSAALQYAKRQRPIVDRYFTATTADRLSKAVDLEARHAAAHSNLQVPVLVSNLFVLEAVDYSRVQVEGDVAFALRCVLAISPLEAVQGWMAEIQRSMEAYRQPTEEQLARFGGVLGMEG